MKQSVEIHNKETEVLKFSHDEELKVTNYLRSRLKEAEERIYLLEQHQLEVRNLPPGLSYSLPLGGEFKISSNETSSL